ncbi:MAG: hypothetical protein EKK40_05915 [Bradyrhizobiaceae bacterium]|nr:MAG: hypothetical protein EKK40_05915 [Bradyrhizobiaceae bacterium]
MRIWLLFRRAQFQIVAGAAAGVVLAALIPALSAAQDIPAHHGLSAEEFSAQSKEVLRRAPRRVRIYNSRTPGPNSVRVCNAHYEQEYRPSGTVIVPRMQCYWSG